MLRFLLIPLFLFSSAVAAENSPIDGYYQGFIGKTDAVMMTLGLPNGAFAGQCRYPLQGAPIWLTSTSTDENKIELRESDRAADASGVFAGAIDDRQIFSGTWWSGTDRRQLPFELKKIAEAVRRINRTSRCRVETFYPRFIGSTPFHSALNEVIAAKAKHEMASGFAEDEKETRDASAGPFPYEELSSAEIIYADPSLVSICRQIYSFAGGAHGMTSYSAVTYAWKDQHLVEINAKDLLSDNSRTVLDSLLVQDLNRQKAALASQARALKFSDLVINPTSGGLMFTFGPAEVDCDAAGTYTVLLPYTSLSKILRSGSVWDRLAKPQ